MRACVVALCDLLVVALLWTFPCAGVLWHIFVLSFTASVAVAWLGLVMRRRL